MKTELTVFPDGELLARVGKTGTGTTIVSRMRTAEDFWKASLTADALRGRGAKRITLLTPYLGYARQDRRVRPGDAAGGPLLLRQLAAAGVTRLVTVDLHGALPDKAAPLALVTIDPWRLFAAALKKKLNRTPMTIAAPDHGALKRARNIAAALPDAAHVWVEKRRVSGTRIRSGRMHGRVKGTVAVIVDDILSTGGTVEAAVRALRKAGIRRVWVAVTHPVFAPGASRRLERLGVEGLLISDSLPKPKTRIPTEVVSIRPLLKKAAH